MFSADSGKRLGGVMRPRARYLAALGAVLVALAVQPSPVTGATAAASDPVALVDGEAVSAQQLDASAARDLKQLEAKVYEVKQHALDHLIQERLLAHEAAREQLSVPQLLDRDVYAKLSAPSTEEVASYYAAVQDRVGQPLEKVRGEIADILTENHRKDAYKAYVDRLQARAHVDIFLDPPRTQVAIDPQRVRGPANAPITIVEFADFECPYCAAVEPTLRKLIAKYPSQIRLAYRDFPLSSHPHAWPSAEAARCALAQGKYWEYHDLLFDNQPKRDQGDLAQFATTAHLDLAKFSECVAQRSYAADVQRDLSVGEDLDINGTPAFFINGISVEGAVPFERFSRVIDAELAYQARTGERH
jgi:protein-disulfide isomerase